MGRQADQDSHPPSPVTMILQNPLCWYCMFRQNPLSFYVGTLEAQPRHLEKEGGVDMDLTENKRAVDAFTYGAGTSGYPPQELLAALLTLDGASLTSGGGGGAAPHLSGPGRHAGKPRRDISRRGPIEAFTGTSDTCRRGSSPARPRWRGPAPPRSSPHRNPAPPGSLHSGRWCPGSP